MYQYNEPPWDYQACCYREELGDDSPGLPCTSLEDPSYFTNIENLSVVRTVGTTAGRRASHSNTHFHCDSSTLYSFSAIFRENVIKDFITRKSVWQVTGTLRRFLVHYAWVCRGEESSRVVKHWEHCLWQVEGCVIAHCYSHFNDPTHQASEEQEFA